MRFKALLLFSLLFLAWRTSVFAQADSSPPPSQLILTDGGDKYPLGLHLEILEDPNGELTIEDVTSPEFDSRFTPSQVEVPNYGFTDSAYWVRLRLRNETRMANRWLLEVDFANMQYVDLYAPSPAGEGFTIKQTGTMRPITTRDISYPDVVFDLTLPTQSQQVYYLRFKSSASMTLPLTLWSPSAFLVHSQQNLLSYGIFFGVMLGLLGYNLFLLFSLREKSYLFLTLFIANMIFFEAAYSGYTDVYLLSNFYSLKSIFLPLTFALIFIWALLFSHSFLKIKARLPKLHRAVIVILSVWGLLILLIPFLSYRNIALLMLPWALPSLVAILAAGIISWRQGSHPARFFLIAWLGLIITLIIVLLVRLGVAPSTDIFENAYHFGLMWMVICWSIALADRINLLKAQSEKASHDLQISEERLVQILEGLPLAVVVYGTDYKPSFINQRVMEILGNRAQGINPDLSAGRTLAEAMKYYSFRLRGSDQEYPIEKLPVFRALQGEAAHTDDVEADLGDRRVPLKIWANPVWNDAGNVESAIVVFEDITQRNDLIDELNKYRKHLESLVVARTAELRVVNKQLNNEIAERELLERWQHQTIEWLSTLNDVRQTIGGTFDLPSAYQKLCTIIYQLLEAHTVVLFLWNWPGDQILAICHPLSALADNDIETLAAIFGENTLLRNQIEQAQPIHIPAGEAASLPPPLGTCLQKEGIQSLRMVPLISRETAIGVLSLALPQPVLDFKPAQASLVDKMSLDLVALAEDALLLDQARKHVAAEERDRLARELHDSVTQTLFTASILAEATPRLWDKNQEIARQNMGKLSVLLRGALAEMRSLLLELRSGDPQDQSLQKLLTTLVDAAKARTQTPIFLDMDDQVQLPSDVNLAFYRISREALNNAMVHAEATRIDVFLHNDPLCTVLRILDNGLGFDPKDIFTGHMGLDIMHERAEQVGADLKVNSTPGRGTEFIVTWSDPGDKGEERD